MAKKVLKKAKSQKTKSIKTKSGNAKTSKAKQPALKKPVSQSAARSTAKAATKAVGKLTGKTTAKMAKGKFETAAAKKVVAKKVAAKTESTHDFEFQPLDDRLLVELVPTATRTPGGLFLPDSTSERPTQGVVVAVGRGHQDKKGRIRPLDVRVGDTVLFAQFAGTPIEFGDARDFSRKSNGEVYVVLRETDLLGVSAD